MSVKTGRGLQTTKMATKKLRNSSEGQLANFLITYAKQWLGDPLFGGLMDKL